MRSVTQARTTRRRLVGGTVLLGTAAALSATDASTAAGSGRGAESQMVASMQEAEKVGEATMPSWTFVVLTYQDPYAQPLLSPKEPEAGKRYIGAQVEIRNDSDRPLAVSPGQIRLRDSDALEYVSGLAVGSDPRLFDVNMSPGERVRGWVWYVVPEAAQAVEIFYVPAAPQLRVEVAPTAAEPEATPTDSDDGTGG